LSTILCILLYRSVDEEVIQAYPINSLSLKIAIPVALVEASNANKYINAPPFWIYYILNFLKNQKERDLISLFKLFIST